MKNNKRNIEKERQKLILYQFAAMVAPNLVITIGYYMAAYVIFVIILRGSLNLYVSAILAGLTGGLWGFGISKGYEIRVKTQNLDIWFSKDDYLKAMIKCSKIVLLYFVIFVVEIILIWYFQLY